MIKKLSIKKIILGVSLIFLVALLSITILKKLDLKKDNASRELIDLGNSTPEKVLSELTLEEKVGQMFIIGFWGTKSDYYITKWLNERNLGGVILLSYNIKSRDQIQTLISDLQELSKNTNPNISLFISTDQEGGTVNRVKVDGFSEFTAQSSIKSYDSAYAIAKIRGSELKTVGFNMNFSPVLDFIKNPKSILYSRVFRGTIEDVSNLGNGMILGYVDSGIIPVAKHFPSHPDNEVDPHEDLPISELSKNSLLLNVSPFQSAIKQNTPIMVGHISYPNIDSEFASSLSETIITEILRNDLGFRGVLITDDLEMGALSKNLSVEQIAKQAVIAGNDILLFSSTPQKYADAYNAIIDAVKKGEIPESIIDNSVLRILKLKKDFLYK